MLVFFQNIIYYQIWKVDFYIFLLISRYGQLGLGDGIDKSDTPQYVDQLKDKVVIQIACGDYNT